MKNLATFEISNNAVWQNYVSKNADGYGRAIIEYAARWAALMETHIAAGEALETFAGATSHEADTEGITGFMYGAAVTTLSECWKHGEALRRWHNKKYQIRDEGDQANETGAVINPALLTIHLPNAPGEAAAPTPTQEAQQ